VVAERRLGRPGTLLEAPNPAGIDVGSAAEPASDAEPGPGTEPGFRRSGRPSSSPALRSFLGILGWDGSLAVAGVVGAGLLRALAVVVEAGVLARVLSVAIAGRGVRVSSAGVVRPAPTLHPLAMASTLVVAALLFGVSGVLAEVAADGAARRARARLRRRGLEAAMVLAAQGADPSPDGRSGVGALASELTSGVDGIDAFVGRYLPHAVLAVAVPLGLLGWIAALDPLSAGLAGLALVLLPIMAGLVGIGTAPAVRRRLEATERLGDRFLALLRGLPLLVAYDRAEAHEEVVRRAGEEARQATLASLRLALLSALVLEIGAAVGTALVAVPLGLRLDAGAPILPAALAVLFVTPEVYLPVRTLAADFHAGAGGRQVLARLESLEARRATGVVDLPGRRALRPGAAPVPRGATLPAVRVPGRLRRRARLEGGTGRTGDPGGPEENDAGPVGALSSPAISVPAFSSQAVSSPAVSWSPSDPPSPTSAWPDAPDAMVDRPADEDGRPVLVRLTRVSVEYPGRERPALTGASLVVRLGDRVALLGPSGAGKSTVLRVIASLVEPTGGRVGRNWPAGSPIGWIPQRPSVVPGSLFDNVALGRPGIDEATVARALRAVGLDRLLEGRGIDAALHARLGDDGRRLSLGERRRLAAARVLAGPRPVLWLLDEPTEGLDEETAARVIAVLARATDGGTVVLATHDRRTLVLTERLVLLDGGKLDDVGPDEQGTSPVHLGVALTPPRGSWPSESAGVAVVGPAMGRSVATEPPATEPPATEPLAIEPLAIEPPVTDRPASPSDRPADLGRLGVAGRDGLATPGVSTVGPRPERLVVVASGASGRTPEPSGLAAVPWARADVLSTTDAGGYSLVGAGRRRIVPLGRPKARPSVSTPRPTSRPSPGPLRSDPTPPDPVVGPEPASDRHAVAGVVERERSRQTESVGPKGRPILRSLASVAGLRAVGLAVAGEVAALGLLTAGAWLLLDASLRPPILLLSVAIALVRLFALVRGAARYGDRLASHDLGLRRQAELRSWLFRELTRAWPRRVRLGDVLSRLLQDTEEVQDLLVRAVVPLTGAAVALVVAAAVAAGLDPREGILLGGGSLVVAGGLIASSYVGGVRRQRVQAAKADVATVVTAGLVAAEELSVLGARQWLLELLGQAEAGLGRATRATARALGAARSVSLAAGTLLVGAVLVVGGRAVLRGELGPVPFGVLGFVAVAAAAVLATVPDALARVPVGREGLRRLRELGAPDAVDEETSDRIDEGAPRSLGRPDSVGPDSAGPDPVGADPGMPPLAERRKRLAPVVRLEGGTIGAPADGSGETTPLLCRVDLELRPGRPVGLVGGSGTGKTTLALTLAGLLPLLGGRLFLDGRDVTASDPRSWRHLVALSEEEPVVFATSVRANLKVVAPWATDEEIRAALAAVGLAYWCDGRTGGLDARIGPWGEPVSGGERQRLGLARALLSGRPVLVLDEPTAHLGPEEAAVVRGTILEVARSRSVLWITHRPEDAELLTTVFDVGAGADGCGRLRPVMAVAGSRSDLGAAAGGGLSLS